MYPRSAGQSDYLKRSESIYEIIEHMEMPPSWIPGLVQRCQEKQIEFCSSPFDEASADTLAPYVNVFKIASYELTHTPLLRHVARFGKPMILSTGTATMDEVIEAVAVVRAEGNEQIVLLQCTASYPTPPESVNVRAMLSLREATGQLVGLSDHSRDPIIAPVVATALGAALIEKHFTLSNQLPGPDHQFAVEPAELTQLVQAVRTAESMQGHGRKEVLPVENELRAFARRSVFSTRAIRQGEAFTASNVAVLRAGRLTRGLAPREFDDLLGRNAARDISAEAPIQWSDAE